MDEAIKLDFKSSYAVGKDLVLEYTVDYNFWIILIIIINIKINKIIM
jgi:hypothetical protein